jgi:hypothetical protein
MSHRSWLLGAMCLFVVGCLDKQTRLQKGDEADKVASAAERDVVVKTVGDVTSVANADPVVVSGVGLVVGLDGTGGDAPPGPYRSLLENQLQKQGVDKPKELLSSPNTSMVLVSALIPAGAHKGDPIDIEVTLPPQCRTSSLRGGYLRECSLFDFDTAKNLDPTFKGPDRALMGHVLGKASGPLLVGFGDGDEAARQKRGRIWGGGKSNIDRAFFLVLNPDQQSARMAGAIAERVNETFHGPYRGALSDMAVAKNNQLVLLTGPQQYQHNLPRYLRVVRMIPLRDGPETHSGYRRKLGEELLDPAMTLSAALRLEALGNESIPVLKKGLASEHMIVRFAAAEALAYLGSASCGDELAKLVEGQVALRAYSLTALASLDDAICHIKLRELLSSERPVTRYGAFRALRTLDERDSAVQGELLNDSFWLHTVAAGSAPLVHVSSSRRAEIVLFGEDMYLTPPFSFLAGTEFTVTASREDDHCMVTRITTKHGTQRRQCDLKLVDAIRTVAELGGAYPDVVELLRQADHCKCLTGALAVDALPQAIAVEELARAGAEDPEFQKADPELVKVRHELGATPNLFDGGKQPHSSATAAKDSDDDDEGMTAKEKKKSAPRRHTTW